jgi:hypothetical protein
MTSEFGVQYIGCEHAQYLVDALVSLYTIITGWPSTHYLGLTLDWYYAARTVDDMFQQKPPKRPQHAPHSYAAPTYGARAQLTSPADDSASLPPAGLTRLQEIIGKLLYYDRAVDSTILVALGTLVSVQA